MTSGGMDYYYKGDLYPAIIHSFIYLNKKEGRGGGAADS